MSLSVRNSGYRVVALKCDDPEYQHAVLAMRKG
jgi:hypothetical protein